jgi:hypothetical protein
VKSEISIVLFESHETVNFYTLQFKGEETETDKFLDKFPGGCKYERDIDIIIKWIEIIGERGALERYFRQEGKIRDNIYAIPLDKSKLRLYIIRVTDNIVIIGNGGIKKTKKYQNTILENHVQLLQEVDHFLHLGLTEGVIQIYNNELFELKPLFVTKRDNEK